MKILRITLVLALIFALVISYFPLQASAVTTAPAIVRIGLYFDDVGHQGATELSLSGAQGMDLGTRAGGVFTAVQTFGPNEVIRLQVKDNHIQLKTSSGNVLPFNGDSVTARPANGSQSVRLWEEGKRYRGLLEFTVVKGKLRVVNELGIEDYLYGVVPKEMSESWPREALKAQAVAARTYVAANVGRYGAYGFDLTDDQYCQAYGAVEVEGDNSRAAVNETKGQILTYGGQAITAVYHSNSGGYTENSENVWTTALPYLKGAPDPYSLGVGSSKDKWEVSFGKDQLGNLINNRLVNNGRAGIGALTGISVLETGVSGRLTRVRLEGTEGSTEIKNDLIRVYLGNLDSTLFQISRDNEIFTLGQSGSEANSLKGKYVVRGDGEVSQLGDGDRTLVGSSGTKTVGATPNKYTFKGQGWGHGVGMSQWGAYGMAKAGKGYKEILALYFQGASLTP
ncbi:MAG TPA: SpoIID/LytB domain-containing protein [Verrucomicrobiae bacterium]|nr:SpoIID/LytB domain-containing protein [Verrucomicrobiae bacterium]